MSSGRNGGNSGIGLFALATAGLLAACGGSAGDPPMCERPSEPLTGGLCALPAASAAHIESVLGLSELAPPRSANETSGITACSFCGPMPVLIHFQESSDQSRFATYRHALETGHGTVATDFPDFGDEAFTLHVSVDGGVAPICLGTRKGNWGLLVCAREVEVAKLQLLETDLFAALGA